MRVFAGLQSLLICAMIAGGCAAKTVVVLVPDPNGEIGVVSVSNEKGSVSLKDANQATEVKAGAVSPSEPWILPKDKIESLFRDVIALQVPPPEHFLLYFESNSIQLKPESKETFGKVLDEIAKRDSKSISVVGHSDTAGNKAYNLELSRKRASAVVNLLIERGIASEFMKSTSHGEENPLVETGDHVSEPRNRRVEVIIR